MQEAVLIKRQSLAKNTEVFWFKTANQLDYQAGQFVEVQIPHQPADDRGEKRWFTLSSAPSEQYIGFTTKLSHPSSTFKKTLDSLRVGATVQLGQAMGDFVLPRNSKTSLVFIAAGIGIAPVRSILTYIKDTNQHRDITIHYGETSEADLCYQDMLQSISGEVNTWLTQPSPTWQGLHGRISTQKILNTLGPQKREKTHFYISGPEKFSESIYTGLSKAGVANSRIRADYFHGY